MSFLFKGSEPLRTLVSVRGLVTDVVLEPPPRLCGLMGVMPTYPVVLKQRPVMTCDTCVTVNLGRALGAKSGSRIPSWRQAVHVSVTPALAFRLVGNRLTRVNCEVSFLITISMA